MPQHQQLGPGEDAQPFAQELRVHALGPRQHQQRMARVWGASSAPGLLPASTCCAERCPLPWTYACCCGGPAALARTLMSCGVWCSLRHRSTPWSATQRVHALTSCTAARCRSSAVGGGPCFHLHKAVGGEPAPLNQHASSSTLHVWGRVQAAPALPPTEPAVEEEGALVARGGVPEHEDEPEPGHGLVKEVGQRHVARVAVVRRSPATQTSGWNSDLSAFRGPSPSERDWPASRELT